MSQTFKTQDEFVTAMKQFYESRPDVPISRCVDCLSLIMRREYAEQILAGIKKLEYRNYTKFYTSRLIDKNVASYIQSHLNDEDVLMFCDDVRQVEKIHFHDYNNSWYLDIECTYNGIFSVTKKDIEFLQKKYGCHDWDADLAYYESIEAEERPYFFYFVCGKVLGTNLTKAKA